MELADRVRRRKAEIEEVILARSKAIADPAEVQDPAYALGLREAIAAALDYGLEAIESSERNLSEIPLSLLAQARFAARAKVPLDTVLRRYLSGYTLLGDFVLEEAERHGVRAGDLKRQMRTQSTLLERLLAAVGEEYDREISRRPASAEERRLKSVRRLLDGESVDASELRYDFDGWHLGLIASGPDTGTTLGRLAETVGGSVLTVSDERGATWAWLGGHRSPKPNETERAIRDTSPKGSTFALGEPGEGLAGWRLTYEQAQAAFAIAQASHRPFVRYAEVALLAATLKDDLLRKSLRQLFLEPLEKERDGGVAARQTLGAYFTAGHQLSTAAVALGITRQTVKSRLMAIEERIGCAPDTCAAELWTALRLSDFPFR